VRGYLLVLFITSFHSLIYLVLARLIIKSLECLLVLFTFVANKLNQESTAKRSKR